MEAVAFIVSAILLIISFALLLYNILKKEGKIHTINIIFSIGIPFFIYTVSYTIISSVVKSQVFDMSSTISKISFTIFSSLIVEIGIVAYFLKNEKEALRRIWILGIVISAVVCFFEFLVAIYDAPLAIVSNESLAFEDVYEKVAYAIYTCMAFSVLAINSFTMIAFKNKLS